MSNVLRCKITQRKVNGSPMFEGTVELPGARATKLVKARNNETTYTSRSAVSQAAKAFANRLGFSDVDFGGDDSTTGTTTKKSAAKSSKALASSSVNSDTL